MHATSAPRQNQPVSSPGSLAGRRARGRSRAAGLVAGYLLDVAIADPARGHPVALFGRAAGALEHAARRDSRARGALCWCLLVLPVAALGALAGRHAPFTATTAATYIALGGTSLRREGATMTRLLTGPDLPAARRRLSHLCSRDASDLGPDDLARATVESLAENTSDAVVAPLLWGAVAGPGGILAYRAANTLDAMWGYRSPRYQRFGWWSARADDVLNLVPARLTALVTVILAPTLGASPADAVRAWREDAPAHPSPNAGPVEATAAGALGVRLGGTSTYSGRTEDRGTLGRGRPVQVGDIERAGQLVARVGALALATCAVLALVVRRG